MSVDKDNIANTNHILQYHKSLIETHGVGSTAALGWMQLEGQQSRFEKLSCIGDMNGCSVLDAGCGHADLFPFLRNKYPGVTYYGYEQMPELLNIAAQRYKGEQGIYLWVGDFLQDSLPLTDYVLASGSLNYRHREKDFIYTAIRTLYIQCRLALGFNLLSGGTEPDTLLMSYDTEDILRFCSRLSSKTELHQGYWKDDFTVFIYR